VPPDVHRPWAADILQHPKPEMPASLRAKHLGGEALCRLIIDVHSGTVRDVVIKKSSGHPDLDASIARTVKQWRIRPNKWREFEIYIGLWPPKSSSPNKA
jgi:TonB family protein